MDSHQLQNQHDYVLDYHSNYNHSHNCIHVATVSKKREKWNGIVRQDLRSILIALAERNLRDMFTPEESGDICSLSLPADQGIFETELLKAGVINHSYGVEFDKNTYKRGVKRFGNHDKITFERNNFFYTVRERNYNLIWFDGTGPITLDKIQGMTDMVVSICRAGGGLAFITVQDGRYHINDLRNTIIDLFKRISNKDIFVDSSFISSSLFFEITESISKLCGHTATRLAEIKSSEVSGHHSDSHGTCMKTQCVRIGQSCEEPFLQYSLSSSK